MCGIVGMRTAEPLGFYSIDKDMLKSMMLVNSQRGSHSTGMAGFSRHAKDMNKVNIVKSINNPFYLFDWPRAEVFMNRMLSDFSTVIGHGRYATHGEINADNAHPFEEGHITLVHNGVINNFYSLKDFNLDKKIDVDSHLVARLIERDGWEKVLPKLKGAYTLVWYDSRDGSLHMARNKERPLYICELVKKKQILWASEWQTISYASQRYGVDVGDITEIKTLTHYMFPFGSIEAIETEYEEEVQKSTTYKSQTTSTTLTKKEMKRLKAKQRQQERNDKSSSDDGVSVMSGLNIGKRITFTVEDSLEVPSVVHDVMRSGRILIKGLSDEYPKVEFRFTCAEDDEEMYYTCDAVEAEVITIVPTDASKTINNTPWYAYVKNVECLHQDAVDDSFILVQTIEGEVSIPSYRFEELSKKPCGWCTDKFKLENSLDSSEVMFHEGDGEKNPDALICPDCTERYKNILLPDTTLPTSKGVH